MARTAGPPSVAAASAVAQLRASIRRSQAALALLDQRAGMMDADDAAQLLFLVDLFTRWVREALPDGLMIQVRQRQGC